MEQNLAPDTLLIRADDQLLTTAVEDELMMMDVETGDYLGLNRVAKDIWSMIETPKSLDQIVEGMMSQYEIDEATCRAQTQTFVQALLQEGYAKIHQA